MSASRPQPAVLAFAHGRNINAADVIALLREIYAEGISTRDEADELVAFDHTLADATTEWREFFAETIADHLLLRREPAGQLDTAKAEWLISALSRGRRIATASGFAAVLRMLDTAPKVPPLFAAYAIDQLRVTLIAGDGPAIGKRPHFSRTIDGEDVKLLARMLIAAGGEAGQPVSRAEAEALFDLHDAVAGAANDQSFDDLFFKTIAYHLFAGAGQAVPSRREMLEFDASRIDADPKALAPEEAAWLAGRIMRDGRPTAAEYLLLRLFSGDPGDAGSSLRRFLDRAA
ncbi:MAG TPA: hypothetical protein VH765_04210 [Xanthobacteraceae bacterium]